MDGAGRGQGDLRNSAGDGLDEGQFRDGDAPGARNPGLRIDPLEIASFPVFPPEAEIGRLVGQPVHGLDKPAIPGNPAELAIGNGAQAHRLLHRHRLADGLILGRRHFLIADFPGVKITRGLFELGRAKQTAHMIRPEWR